MNQKLNILTDVFLRFSTMGGKFVLLIFIVQFLAPASVGEYGLIASLIGFMLYVVGLDFYTFSTRELIHQKIHIWTVIYNQIFFLAINYIIVGIFWLQVSSFSGVNRIIWYVFFLLISEHLSQEFYRLLIILKKITMANIQVFIRMGIWCYICAILFLWNFNLTLDDIIILWLISSISSVFFALVIIIKIEPIQKSYFYLDLFWIRDGIRTAMYFFIGTILLRVLFYFDKVLINQLSGISVVGIYVFFLGIINSVQNVLEVIVISRCYPEIVESVNQGDRTRFYTCRQQMFNKVLSTSICLYLLSIPCCWVLLYFQNKPEYLESFYLYPLMCVGWSIFSLSLTDHYVLFGLKKDRYILLYNFLMIIAFFITFLLGYSLINNAVLSVTIAFICAYSVLYFLKRKKASSLLT